MTVGPPPALIHDIPWRRSSRPGSVPRCRVPPGAVAAPVDVAVAFQPIDDAGGGSGGEAERSAQGAGGERTAVGLGVHHMEQSFQIGLMQALGRGERLAHPSGGGTQPLDELDQVSSELLALGAVGFRHYCSHIACGSSRAGLLRAMSIALAHRTVIACWPRVGHWLLWGLLGIYTGWSSMAIWVNLTTALAGSGAPISGVAGTVGQLAVLAGATATAVAIVRWTSGSLSYAAAVARALGTAALGATQAGEPVLGIAAVIGLAVVVATLIERRVRSASWARLAHTPSHR